MKKVVKSAEIPTKLLVMVSVPASQYTSGRGGHPRGLTLPLRQKCPGGHSLSCAAARSDAFQDECLPMQQPEYSRAELG